ncbi:MAG: histidine triad nucleotide-binding protein [Endomicrobia bacterium]|nr:histidine triad nucleotide-binding protein [Endomicrobiia bacterium]MCX7941242.1 histidine triad nucleotide-binding protein [Endomicrobiia bacterium]MDW8056064.1 histidine triad nucleotide-binding protein [Elusimicrobiota bacterium]
MKNCIFCRIINKEIPSEIVYEDDDIIVFKDINPQAPIHLLIVPKQHIESINNIDKDSISILGKVFYVAKEVSSKFAVSEEGYRIVVNTGKNAGQEVLHLHFHFLAGRKFSWPPG